MFSRIRRRARINRLPDGVPRQVLALASSLDPDGIPEALFTTAAVTGHLAVGADDVRAALRELHRLRLIKNAPVVRVPLDVRGNAGSFPETVAADALAELWPRTENGPGHARMLRANVAALHTDRLCESGVHRVLFRVTNSLGESGQPAAAIALLERMLDQALTSLGPDHPDVLAIRHNIAYWLGKSGREAAAVGLLTGLLEAEERALGPDHPGPLSTRRTLAELRGDPPEVLETLVADHVRVHGPDHPETFGTRGVLATRRGEDGDPAGAVAEFERLVTDLRRKRGDDDPELLTARGNIALWHAEGGNARRAERIATELLPDVTRVLGPDAVQTLDLRADIARFQGEASGSEDGAARTAAALAGLVPDYRRVLGADHPRTLSLRTDVARWHTASGDRTAGVREYQSVHADLLRVLGPDADETHLALIGARSAAGDLDGMTDALEQVFRRDERLLGADHPDTIAARARLEDWRARLR
ncbi:tetratricopeptide repeat protein [Actinoplanes sp. NPDC051861]|uniref:tetratricopeptide repeat protein n=1 Tax=Actinoplanes sp. NPDC051861 TaxID=3155170 RepID=UPI0034470EDC